MMTLTDPITSGRGLLGTIYDRLRKRSYRRFVNWNKAVEEYYKAAWGDESLTDEEYEELFVEFEKVESWEDIEHAAYVRGVKDALQATQEA